MFNKGGESKIAALYCVIMNTCLNCKHWQCANGLRDRTHWSDCYHIIATIQPKLLLCYNEIDEDTKEYFKVPFDPHDVKYWWYNNRFMNWYNNLPLYIKWIPEIKHVKVKEEDFKYDQHGAERLAVVTLHYFQTNRDYICSQWEEK